MYQIVCPVCRQPLLQNSWASRTREVWGERVAVSINLSQPQDEGRQQAIFLSYRRVDRAAADRLFELLTNRGIAVWYDAMIGPGEDWREAIEREIREARLMVVFISPESFSSEEQKRELGLAGLHHTPMLPVRIKDVPLEGAFSYQFAKDNWFDIFDWPERRLNQLAGLIASDATKRLASDTLLKSRIRQLQDRRRWELFGSRGMLRNNVLLALVMVFAGAVVLLSYSLHYRPFENWVGDPLVAYATLATTVTVGSPLMLSQLLAKGIEGHDGTIIAGLGVNVTILVLFVRNFGSWVGRMLFRRH